MKKVAAILCLALLVCFSSFATNKVAGNAFRLRSTVRGISIERAHSASRNGLFTVLVGNTIDTIGSSALVSVYDISLEDVVGYFSIVQNETTKTNESIHLSVSAEVFMFTDANGSIWESKLPVASNFIGLENESVLVGGEEFGNEVGIDVNYMGGHTGVVDGTVLATFQITWPRTESLYYHGGDYASNIVLTYDIV